RGVPGTGGDRPCAAAQPGRLPGPAPRWRDIRRAHPLSGGDHERRHPGSALHRVPDRRGGGAGRPAGWGPARGRGGAGAPVRGPASLDARRLLTDGTTLVDDIYTTSLPERVIPNVGTQHEWRPSP